MAKRKSSLALIAAGIGGAAVAGYGLSIGRDLWKSTKKNQMQLFAILALIGAITLPTLGARELVKGHDRGVAGTVFKTIIGSIVLTGIGFVLAVMCLSLITRNDNDPDAGFGAAIFLASCSTAVFSLIGFLWGVIQRPSRVKTISTAKANEQFLASIGFRETGGDDVTHYDASGQALRFLEGHGNRLVFMAVGRRGKRAFIDLAPDGKMVAYSGVV
ncbi:hypothetical protein [Mesorhizobium sp. dw_380]|uniref:hypothetical protein n=1 Tax=Mesorhizobium sp. dw_380 TaxID=2812001 RepID=UPI001BDEDBFB|nr:hypothetical protein [Mesorhizobium sp. dw_380]